MKKYITLILMTMAFFCCLCIVNMAEDETPDKKGKIKSSKPEYLPKDHEAWKTKGRIVGITKQEHDFKVKILSESKQVITTVDSEKLEKGGRAYEIWLKPDTYIMIIAAEGYEDLDLKNLKVKAWHDLRIDLEFTKQ